MADREKVIKWLEQCKKGGSCDGCQYDINSSRCIFLLHEDALALLKEQPQIVRCKDCKKRYDSMNCPIALIADLLKNTRVFEYKVSDDWFCADGER